ncbi:MAG: hypothetical protein FJ149_09210 [Euryarchaeota archaeon]|nr:hypothetical protein [Euryarchaeota archaeon]
MRKMRDILTLVCGYLNRQKIGYVLVGGVAVSVHGIPRSTVDADMILSIDEKGLPALVRFLKRNGFLARLEDARAAFKERSHFTVEDTRSGLRLDLKGIYNEMDENAFGRRQKFRFRDGDIMIQTPEDLIAAKLFYGSEQDILDAEGVFRIQEGRLDMGCLKKLCRAYGVSRKLDTLEKRVRRP